MALEVAAVKLLLGGRSLAPDWNQWASGVSVLVYSLSIFTPSVPSYYLFIYKMSPLSLLHRTLSVAGSNLDPDSFINRFSAAFERGCGNITLKEVTPAHSFKLSYDRSKASSKASSPHSAIQSVLLQMRVSSPFLKVIQ
jgi:hypothetical protein